MLVSRAVRLRPCLHTCYAPPKPVAYRNFNTKAFVSRVLNSLSTFLQDAKNSELEEAGLQRKQRERLIINDTPKPQQQEVVNTSAPVTLQDRFKAAMVLAGVGDALGYNNGKWEFTYNGRKIHKEFEDMGGLAKLNMQKMLISDDQMMHLATAEALVGCAQPANPTELYKKLSESYIESFKDMFGRSAGPMTERSVTQMENGIPYNAIKYSPAGGGCGGSMRAMCIGLRYYGEENRNDLIAVSIESGRMTHNHPTGFFGALASALFTAYAIEGVPVVQWGRKMVKEILPKAYTYLEDSKRDWDLYQPDLKYFEESWIKYLKMREIWEEGKYKPVFPEKYDVDERDAFYKSISFAGWGGASGHDSVIIAYDALLGAGNDFNQLVLRGVLHGGDNDSTGVISASWWGAMHGFSNIPSSVYQNLEKRSYAELLGNSLYELRNGKAKSNV